MIIFSVYLFVMILMVAGIGIDLMRFERDRAALQYTLDRAVLAAADLDQPLPPKEVVIDYFNKAGLSEYLNVDDIKVTPGVNFRNVSATALANMQTQFMHMTGVDSLAVPAAGTAEERLDNLEISLVLDVSGSMDSNSRIGNLKIAAKDFIDTMDQNSEDGKLSVSIIPYATQVSLPDELMAEFTVNGTNDFSNCINFTSADFSVSTINPNSARSRTMHFDPFSSKKADGRDNDPKVLVGGFSNKSTSWPTCEHLSSREMLLLEKNPVKLKNYIDALVARGNTSIDVGMKWGTALLDPSIRPTIAKLAAPGGTIYEGFVNRPTDYTQRDTLKVIVLMTDGANTSQYFVRGNYDSGNSNVWWNDQEEEYSTYNPSNGKYYVPRDNSWHNQPYGNGQECTSYNYWGNCNNWQDEPGEAVRLTYPELWAYTTMEWVERNLYDPWKSTSSTTWRSSVGSGTKNARTKSICDAAKARQIVVYAIAFEAPSSGRAVLKDCASSPSHYFHVNADGTGININEAFAAIASSIRLLKLVN